MNYFQPTLFVSTDYTPITFSHQGLSFQILALNSASTDFDLTGQVIWPAALDLAQFIVQNSQRFKAKRVLELGAGAGMSGIVASQFAEKIYLTDGNQQILKLLNLNSKFSKCQCQTALFQWGGAFKQKVDIIIGADVVFWPQSIEPLVKTLAITAYDLCFLSLKQRSLDVERRLDQALQQNGLKRIQVQRRRVPTYQIIKL